jgi:nicotinamidase-related amidase
MMSISDNAALLIIDVQQGLDHPKYGVRNNPDAERRMAEVLAAWRAKRRPVIHVQHMSTNAGSMLRPGLPGNAIKPEVQPLPGEPLFRKNVNSAFIGTELETHLRMEGIDELVIMGLTTDHCVSSTARMAANLGFAVTVLSDATAAFERTGPDGTHFTGDMLHSAELASLHGEFATVVLSTELDRA